MHFEVSDFIAFGLKVDRCYSFFTGQPQSKLSHDRVMEIARAIKSLASNDTMSKNLILPPAASTTTKLRDEKSSSMINRVTGSSHTSVNNANILFGGEAVSG